MILKSGRLVAEMADGIVDLSKLGRGSAFVLRSRLSLSHHL
jgi:hypothetical protein